MNDNIARAYDYTKDLRNALRAEIQGYERGGPKPSVYETLRALDLIVAEGENDDDTVKQST